jgi:hypothetical protein
MNFFRGKGRLSPIFRGRIASHPPTIKGDTLKIILNGGGVEEMERGGAFLGG